MRGAILVSLKMVGAAEVADDDGHVALGGIHLGVEMAHVGGGNFSGEIGEGGAELGKLREGRLADDGDRVVRREVMAVVFEGEDGKSVEGAIGGIAGDDVHLMSEKRAIEEAEVHNGGSRGEMEVVAIAPAAEAVGALEEFVADAGAPLGSESGDVGGGAEMQAIGVLAADDHGEGIFKTERLGQLKRKALSILLFDAAVDGGGAIRAGGFVENGGESGAGVLDVEIEIAGEKSFVDEERAAEVGFADDGDAGAGFNVLSEKFGKNDLLGEKFGADGEMRPRMAASDGEKKSGEEASQKREAAHE